MFTKSLNASKVKFKDQQLDDYVLENSVLKSKLHSKIEALSIMSKELDKCSMERDRYRLLVDQLKNKHFVVQRSEDNVKSYRVSHSKPVSGGELLANTREQNSVLKLEVETLRTKLEETTGDIEALRKQLRFAEDTTISVKSYSSIRSTSTDYEELVQQLEKIKKKYQQIQLDFRAALDEREELVCDRDYYKSKVLRLNHQISYIIASKAKVRHGSDEEAQRPIVDIDAIVMENRYLQERLTQLQVEKEIVKQTLSKYKTLLENRKKNSSLGFSDNIDVMTQKQVRTFLERNPKNGTKKATMTDLKSLCLGLFESLNDKSIALQHQRKTNQILANRITELEKTLESWSQGEKYIPIFPSQMLLDEFCPESENTKAEDIKMRGKQVEEECDSKSDDGTIKNGSGDNDENSSKMYSESYHNIKNCDEQFSEKIPMRKSSKTILPPELEELVREAMAEMK